MPALLLRCLLQNLDASTTCGIVVSPVDGATQCLVTDCTQLGLVCENNECVCPSPLTRPCTDAGGTTFCFPGPECPSCAAPVCPPAGEEPVSVQFTTRSLEGQAVALCCAVVAASLLLYSCILEMLAPMQSVTD